MMKQLEWFTAFSTRPSLDGAIREIVEQLENSGMSSPDLGILFVSSTYASDYGRVLPLLLESLSIPLIIGCGGGGIVGTDGDGQILEVEGSTAISLTLLCLPGVEIIPFYLKSSQIPDLDSSPESWTSLLGVSADNNPQFILLSDPFFDRINDLLEGLDFAYPDSTKVGGLASSGAIGIPSTLFYYREQNAQPTLMQEGTIGVALKGDILVEAIVAQGCRPIGPIYRIQKAERNIILELAEDGDSGVIGTPLDLLRNLISELDEQDRQLAQNSLFVGMVGDEFKFKPAQGDFLIRNLLGVDPRVGAVAVGDRPRPGQRIQFHLRDSNTSAEDLELLFTNYQGNLSADSVMGALMFSCLGRGENLYGQPNFDSQLWSRYFNNLPLGGFFCNGEIGPVAQRTFIHGYTSVFAIFRRP